MSGSTDAHHANAACYQCGGQFVAIVQKGRALWFCNGCAVALLSGWAR